MKPPTKLPSKGVIAGFANAAGLTIQSTGSYPTTHTITWSHHHGCFDAAERVQLALQQLGYGVEIKHTDSNAYGKGSLKISLPLFLDAAIRSAVEAAVAENPKIRYAHAMTLTDVGDRRDIKFVLGMHRSQLRFGTADDAFNAMTGVHNHVIKATFTAYDTHVVMGPTLSCRGRSHNLAMIMAFSPLPDPAATAIEVQTIRNRK